MDWPEAGGEFTGDAGRGEDCEREEPMVSYKSSALEVSQEEVARAGMAAR